VRASGRRRFQRRCLDAYTGSLTFQRRCLDACIGLPTFQRRCLDARIGLPTPLVSPGAGRPCGRPAPPPLPRCVGNPMHASARPPCRGPRRRAVRRNLRRANACRRYGSDRRLAPRLIAVMGHLAQRGKGGAAGRGHALGGGGHERSKVSHRRDRAPAGESALRRGPGCRPFSVGALTRASGCRLRSCPPDTTTAMPAPGFRACAGARQPDPRRPPLFQDPEQVVV